MDAREDSYTDKQRWWILTRINALSALSQIVQIGTVTPLLSLSLEQQNVEPAQIGLVVSASWIAILLLYKAVPRLLSYVGLVNANLVGATLSIVALLGMSLTQRLTLLFMLNFVSGAGLILRWVACDTWIFRVASERGRGRAIGVHETLMGLGIAVGPLLLVACGVGTALPYYACAALLLLAAALAMTLRRQDTRPEIPANKQHSALFGVIPVALCWAFMAGFTETSALSFLAPYSLYAGYAMASATLLIAVFGAGGTLLQLPVGWLADRTSYKTGQLVCSLMVLLGTVAIPFSQTLPWLAALIVFVWGGAIGGLNTLAVIEAGSRVGVQQISTAMAAIALFFTLGSILGPIITGATVSYLSPHGLMIAAGVAGTLFVLLLTLGKTFRR